MEPKEYEEAVNLRTVCIFFNNDRHPVPKTFTPLHYTCRHFASSHLNFTQLHFTTLQPEGGRRHVTLKCCVHRQDRMTSQHVGARIHTPMKKSHLIYVAACLKLLNLNFAVL